MTIVANIWGDEHTTQDGSSTPAERKAALKALFAGCTVEHTEADLVHAFGPDAAVGKTAGCQCRSVKIMLG